MVAEDAEALKEKVRDPFGLKSFVRERPLASVGIAAGAGLATAWLLAGGGSRRKAGREEDDDDAKSFGLGAAAALAFRSFVLPRLTRAAKDAAMRAVRSHQGNGHAAPPAPSEEPAGATPPWFR